MPGASTCDQGVLRDARKVTQKIDGKIRGEIKNPFRWQYFVAVSLAPVRCYALGSWGGRVCSMKNVLGGDRRYLTN